MKKEEIRALLEALLFVAEEPVPTKDLAEALPREVQKETEDHLKALAGSYDGVGRGLQLVQVAGGWRLQTRPDLFPWVSKFLQVTRKERLSRQALETLAVVTYHQPVTAPEVGEIRGVDPTSPIKTLLERGLIRIAGRKEVVGRPFLYATTHLFLEEFGLNTLDDLPDLREFEDLLEEKYSDSQQDLFRSPAAESEAEPAPPVEESPSAESTEGPGETGQAPGDAGKAEHHGDDEQRVEDAGRELDAEETGEREEE